MNDIFRSAVDDLLQKSERESYTIMVGNTDTKNICRTAISALLPDCCDMTLAYDSSGAPIVTVRRGSRMLSPFVSLSGENGLSACFALLPTETSSITGVGIDLSNQNALAGVLNKSYKHLTRTFFPDEINYILSLPSDERLVTLNAVFAAKEAAFKSITQIYRIYRRKNDDKPLDVSMMDFGIISEGCFLDTVTIKGVSAGICKREHLEISFRIVPFHEMIGAVAICRKLNCSANIGKS